MMKHRLKHLLSFVFFVWVLGLYGHQAPAVSPPATKSVAIIYTSEMQGALEPCG
jgi:hypothetical protein